jgi:hypothetical protein
MSDKDKQPEKKMSKQAESVMKILLRRARANDVAFDSVVEFLDDLPEEIEDTPEVFCEKLGKAIREGMMEDDIDDDTIRGLVKAYTKAILKELT